MGRQGRAHGGCPEPVVGRNRSHADENILTAAGVEAVPAGLRSNVENRWRADYETAGSSAVDALREADPGIVADEPRDLGTSSRARRRSHTGSDRVLDDHQSRKLEERTSRATTVSVRGR